MDKRIGAYLAGTLSASEVKALLEEAQTDTKLKEALRQGKTLKGLLTLHTHQINLEEGLQAYQKRLHLKMKRRFYRFSIRWIGVAALLVAATWFITDRALRKTSQAMPELAFSVPAGQRASLRLSDGTLVWLNANSTLHYPALFGSERRVFLSGEGYFEVAKNKKKPFIVSTPTLNVQALGTKFNVFSYPRFAEKKVYLVEGKVKVSSPTYFKQSILMKPNEELDIRKEQSVLLPNTTGGVWWKEGLYLFKEQTLPEIKDRLELYFDVHIKVTNTHLCNHTYTGKFRQTDGVMEILRLLQKIYKFQIRYDREQNIIYLS